MASTLGFESLCQNQNHFAFLIWQLQLLFQQSPSPRVCAVENILLQIRAESLRCCRAMLTQVSLTSMLFCFMSIALAFTSAIQFVTSSEYSYLPLGHSSTMSSSWGFHLRLCLGITSPISRSISSGCSRLWSPSSSFWRDIYSLFRMAAIPDCDSSFGIYPLSSYLLWSIDSYALMLVSHVHSDSAAGMCLTASFKWFHRVQTTSLQTSEDFYGEPNPIRLSQAYMALQFDLVQAYLSGSDCSSFECSL